jgi:Rrf2 family protein
MQILTRETDYAVRALAHVAAAPSGITTAIAISRKERLPWLFLRRVMQRLAAEGLLRSQKGRSGGFRLARPASRINLVDVVRVFQGPLEMSDCLVRGLPCCNRPSCPIRRKLRDAEARLRRELSSITIEMLARTRRKGESH